MDIVSTLLLALASPTPVAVAEPSAAEKAAIFKAAGFKPKGEQFVRCEDSSASAMPGSIEMQDLTADGVREAWVRESSGFCYGATAEAFVLLASDARGAWRILLDEVGVALPLETKTKGWLDIEVGGPGMGPFPKFGFDGKTYVRK